MRNKLLKITAGFTGLALIFALVANVSAADSLLASGDVTAEAGGTTFDLMFNVKNTNPATGNVLYQNSQGDYFKGSVNCFYRDGNEAAFGGEVVDGTYTEGYFLVEVQDGDPDRVRVRLFDSMPDCELSGSFPGEVVEGDLEVFDVEQVSDEPEPQTLVVDDDGDRCPDATYTNIQDAVDAANPGDTVKVCTGEYAGAVVDKEVHLVGYGKNDVVINDGPNSHSFLRAGFLFNDDYSGSDSSIKRFRFEGTMQEDYTDDGNLDFAVFSRGADRVTLEYNVINNTLQAITNWHGDGWDIQNNKIRDLWTINGGGIGIFVGSNDGTDAIHNDVMNNVVVGTLQVSPIDNGGYNGTGVVLYSDYRFGSSGGELRFNRVIENRVKLVSNNPSVVDAVAFEATDTRDDVAAAGYPVVHDNVIRDNAFNGSANEYDFTPDDLINHNVYLNNSF